MYMPADRPNPAMRYDQGPSSPLRLLLNILWLVFGGFFAGLAWLFAAAIMAITIIGLPWCLPRSASRSTPSCRSGRRSGAVPMPGRSAFSATSSGSCLPDGGWRSCHLCVAVALAVTIIGIPFAWAHLKLAGASLAPVGTEVVPRGTPRVVVS